MRSSRLYGTALVVWAVYLLSACSWADEIQPLETGASVEWTIPSAGSMFIADGKEISVNLMNNHGRCFFLRHVSSLAPVPQGLFLREVGNGKSEMIRLTKGHPLLQSLLRAVQEAVDRTYDPKLDVTPETRGLSKDGHERFWKQNACKRMITKLKALSGEESVKP